MNLCHVVFAPDSLTYLVAKAATFAGHSVYIALTDPDRGKHSTHKIMQRIVRIPGVAIMSPETDRSLPAAFDRLIVQVFPRPPVTLASSLLQTMARRSRRITLVSAGDRSRSRRMALQLQWREMRALLGSLSKIDRVVYKDGAHTFDLFAPWKTRRVVGFDVHSMFMDDDAAFTHIQSLNWAADASRPIFVNFMGSQDPAIRKSTLDSMRHLFPGAGGISQSAITSKRVLWHEYSDAQPGALGLAEFVDALTNSDFTLCPPGYSLITHRPIEAMLRGSIPILHANELDLYDISLVDGVNCVAVPPGQWPEAVERCAAMDEHTIRAMRQAIKDMVPKLLHYEASSRRLRQRLGLDG